MIEATAISAIGERLVDATHRVHALELLVARHEQRPGGYADTQSVRRLLTLPREQVPVPVADISSEVPSPDPRIEVGSTLAALLVELNQLNTQISTTNNHARRGIVRLEQINLRAADELIELSWGVRRYGVKAGIVAGIAILSALAAVAAIESDSSPKQP